MPITARLAKMRNFDLVRDRAINYIVLDEHGKFIVIDPRDKTPLKILMAYQESKSQLCDRIFIHSKAKSSLPKGNSLSL
ncbi:MAG: hypothetical protein MET45_26685 [Nostoc sp. LLA-1]|nr:hypothetical protein [Cyanocohniella sp. LLY]